MKSLAFFVVGLLLFLAVVDIQVRGLKGEINQGVRTQCLQSGPGTASILGKYDDLAQALVDQQTTAYQLNIADNNKVKAAADLVFAKRFRADLIRIVKQDCSRPFIK